MKFILFKIREDGMYESNMAHTYLTKEAVMEQMEDLNWRRPAGIKLSMDNEGNVWANYDTH